MAKRKVSTIKSFSNIDELFARMGEQGYFFNENHRDEELARIKAPTPLSQTNEYWYSNGADELKIFKKMFGAFELCNYRGIISPRLEELFELAEIPKIGARK